jgi:hypothetical protein
MDKETIGLMSESKTCKANEEIAHFLLNTNSHCCINLEKTERRLFHLKTQSVPRCKHFHLGYKNQSVYDVSGTSRCLFSDKYKTHKYSVGRAYNC